MSKKWNTKALPMWEGWSKWRKGSSFKYQKIYSGQRDKVCGHEWAAAI